jgi:hypothetical protein
MTGNKADIFGTRAKNGITLILAFIALSTVISIFNSFFSTSQFLKREAEEIGKLFESGKDFTPLTKELLSTRSDIAYLKLLDKDGILRESIGTEGGVKVKKFRLYTANKNTIILGLKEIENKQLIFHSLVWSVIIGVLFSGIYIFAAFSSLSKDQNVYLERVIMAIKRVSRGDFTSRLDVDKPVEKDAVMIRLFESFNQMVDQLRRKKEEVIKEPSRFQPTVIVPEKKEETKIRRVIAFVAKISNFEELSTKVGTAEFSSFLTEYRKAASSIVSDYGGVIEALLQDEIVALFNVPDEQDKPELRAVCAAVGVLKVLANMNKKRRVEGKETIGGKIGIEVKSIPFYVESGIPQGVKEAVALARGICEDAPLWKVLVSPEIYKFVSDHVDAKELAVTHGTSFSIVAVEEGVIRI